MLGTTDRRAKSLWLSFCLLFLSDTIFLEAGDEAAPSGELESYDPEIASSKGQLFVKKWNKYRNLKLESKIEKERETDKKEELKEPVVFKLFVLEEGVRFPVIAEFLVDSILHFPTNCSNLTVWFVSLVSCLSRIMSFI